MNLLVADFDNDGHTEAFKDNTMNDGTNSNGLFKMVHVTSEHQVTSVNEKIDENLMKASVQGKYDCLYGVLSRFYIISVISRRPVRPSMLSLTLSETSPGFYMSAVHAF